MIKLGILGLYGIGTVLFIATIWGVSPIALRYTLTGIFFLLASVWAMLWNNISGGN